MPFLFSQWAHDRFLYFAIQTAVTLITQTSVLLSVCLLCILTDVGCLLGFDCPRVSVCVLKGLYSGRVMIESEYKRKYVSVEQRRNHIRFFAEMPVRGLFPEDSTPLVDPWPDAGNETMAINDPKGSGHPANCMLMQVLYLGWPYLCVVTTRSVRKGAELYMEYGTHFWTLENVMSGNFDDISGSDVAGEGGGDSERRDMMGRVEGLRKKANVGLHCSV